MKSILKLSLAATLSSMALGATAQTEIQWWHAMGGKNGELIQGMADKFNASQDKYKINPVFKGSYSETMTAAIAAFRAKQQPAIVQVFEVGTATMMYAKDAIY
ncbi:MAG TPA: sn-glycerol-3-phosphate ABC transporter substrate-binding protein, partial [Orrella sp.]